MRNGINEVRKVEILSKQDELRKQRPLTAHVNVQYKMYVRKNIVIE